MQQNIKEYAVPHKTIIVSAGIVAMIVLMSFVFKPERVTDNCNDDNLKKDSIASVKAFMQVYKVLISPRCMNCHPAGNVPLQGDDSHLHAMLPRRGVTGKGVYAMKCSNCHQSENSDGPGKPPGAPHWQLPPANMKMIFQGRTANQLAKQLVNPKTNGNKNLPQLKAHADDGLVKAGWNMGEGRTLPPMSYDAFKKAWITWIDNGAYAPAGK